MKLQGVSGVLLAGGQSRRMGQDKRRLSVGEDTLLQRVLSVFETVFEETIIVVAEHSSVTDGLRHLVLTDIIPKMGPVGGLYTGLTQSKNDHVFLAACDMPFLDPFLISRIFKLFTESHGMDISMVKLNTGMQPMQGIYSKKCLKSLKEMVNEGRLSLKELKDNACLKVRIIEQDELVDLDQNFVSFMNINTPADLEMANKLIRS